MTREEAITLMKGAACSKTLPSELAIGLTQAQALKLVRHYVKCLPKGVTLGLMVAARVQDVTVYKRQH